MDVSQVCGYGQKHPQVLTQVTRFNGQIMSGTSVDFLRMLCWETQCQKIFREWHKKQHITQRYGTRTRTCCLCTLRNNSYLSLELSLIDESEVAGVHNLSLVGVSIVADKGTEVGIHVVIHTKTRLYPIASGIISINSKLWRSTQ